MFRYAVLCFGVLASVSGHLNKEDAAELHKLVLPTAEKCSEQLGIPMDAFENLKKTHDPGTLDPCFLACMFKEHGILTEEGMIDKEASIVFVSKFLKDEEDLKKLGKVGETCLAVNEEELTGDDKGCARVKLLTECFSEHKSELGVE